MKYYEMLDVYRFIKETLKPESGQYYDKYIEKMDALFENLEPYFPKDKKSVYPPISEEEYKRIDKIFDEAAKASNDFIHSYDNTIEEENANLPPIQAVAVNLNNEFFSKAYVEYKNIKPNPHFSLKDQMEDFRYVNVEITSDELKKLGAAQSSRTQMSVNINNKNVNGVFTNMTFLEGKKKTDAVFAKMIEKYPKYASFFKSIDTNEFSEKGISGITVANFLDKKGKELVGERAEEAMTDFFANSNFSDATIREARKFIRDDDFYYACTDFAREIDTIRVGISLNKRVLGLKDGDRIDARNSAMSAVANLLGQPNLLAKSRPLVVFDDKGNKYQEGTFMEFANGKDINHLDVVDEMRLMDEDDFESPEVKQQLANLQVLDYICGNIDRHAGNMLYQIDPKTRKLTGITGIDNDCAFFKNKLSVNKNLVRLPSLNSLRVIDEDMANTISNLTEGQLKATLHGFGLDKDAVDAAWHRTQQLQKMLSYGHQYSKYDKVLSASKNKLNITIMKKEDWEKVSLSDCCKGSENYFLQMGKVAKMMDKPETINAKVVYQKNASQIGLRASMSKSQSSFLLKKAKDASPWFFASNRYKNILTKLKDYDDTQIVGDNPLSSENDNKFVKLYELKHAIDVYKMEKMSDGFIDENWNVKRDLSGKDLERVLLVKNMETYVNRVELERQAALEAKERYDEEKKKCNDVAKFLDKTEAQKENLVNKKLERQAAKKVKEENIINTSEVAHDTNLNNEIVNNNNLIKPEEVEINVAPQVDNEKENEKEVIKDLEKDIML